MAWFVLAVALAACSSGDDGGGAGAGGTGGGRAGGGGQGDEEAIAFTVTDVRVQSMAAEAAPFPEDVWVAVHGTMNAYLDLALVRPLRTGEPPTGLEPLFTQPALDRATTGDRAAMVEDGAELRGSVTSPRANLALVLLTDRAGAPVVVNVTVDLVLSVEADDDDAGTVALARNGQVVLVQDEQGWRIDSYDVVSLRDTVA